MEQVGTISGIIQVFVVVQSTRGVPALNEDTLLFLMDRTPLGLIFETFGPVVQPCYSVRFNSEKEVADLDLQPGNAVYYAPALTTLTHYVFMEELRRQTKGSDASWKDNNEPPVKYLDYSDDEQERAAKGRKKRGQKDADENGEDAAATRRRVRTRKGQRLGNTQKTVENHQCHGHSSNSKQLSWNSALNNRPINSFQSPPPAWQHNNSVVNISAYTENSSFTLNETSVHSTAYNSPAVFHTPVYNSYSAQSYPPPLIPHPSSMNNITAPSPTYPHMIPIDLYQPPPPLPGPRTPLPLNTTQHFVGQLNRGYPPITPPFMPHNNPP